MNTDRAKLYIMILMSLIALSCIDIKQKTHINSDGSGIVNLHYSTKLSNLSMGDELGDYAFSEIKAKNFLTSANSEVREFKMEKRDSDSTLHVSAVVNFKDFNKLNSAKTFSKFNTLWRESAEGYEFSYNLHKDSTAAKSVPKGSGKLEYEFDFPGEVEFSNGTHSGSKANWSFDLSETAEGFDMTAKIKSAGGLFGLLSVNSIIIILLAVLAFITIRNFVRNRESRTKS